MTESTGGADAHRYITITREFDAPRQLVFDAWVMPEHLLKWFRAAPDWTTPHVTTDPRPGGSLSIGFGSPDGKNDFDLTGSYDEVRPPEYLSFTMTDGRPVMVTLVEQPADRTLLTLKFAAESTHSEDLQRAGWGAMVENLATHLDALRSPIGDPAAAGDDPARQIVVSRVFTATPEELYAAFTDKARIGEWWGPRGFTTTTHSMHVLNESSWRFTMHGPDGTDYENTVTYTRVEPPTLLAYKHYGKGDEAEPHFRALVLFEQDPAGTLVTLRMTFPDVDARKAALRFGVVEGGEQTLERLAEHLAGSKM